MNPIRDIFENGYFHSLHYMTNKKVHWSEKLFWLICIMLSLCGAMQIISDTIISYQSQKVAIKVEVNYLDFETLLPSIFFCEKREMGNKILNEGESRFGENFTTEGGASDNVEYLRSVIFYIPFETTISDSYCYKLLQSDSQLPPKCEVVHSLKDNYENFSNSVRSKCYEMFNTCVVDNKSYNCCDILFPIDTYMGKCYAFNSYNSIRFENGTERKPQVDFKIPVGHGNKMYANVSVEVKHQDLSIWYMTNSALPTKMQQKDNHFDADGIRGRYLEVILRVEQTIAEQSVLSLPVKTKGCRRFNESNLEDFKFYSVQACEIQCIKKAQLKFCLCVTHVLPSNLTKNSRKCDFYGMHCVYKEEKTNILNYINTKCPCDSNCQVQEVYKVGFLSDPRGTAIQPFRSKDTVKCIDFIVNAPYIRYVRYSTKQGVDFIVAVGGLFGLFWGCSFLSFTQLIYYFIIKPITDCIRNRRRQNIEKKNKKVQAKFIENCKKLRLNFHEMEKTKNKEKCTTTKRLRTGQPLPFIH